MLHDAIVDKLIGDEVLALFTPGSADRITSVWPPTKSPDSSNPTRSASQSVHFPYILEKIETPRGMRRSFCLQRTGESRFMPDSVVSASILSVRSKKRFASALERALVGVRPTIAAPGDRRLKFQSIGSVCPRTTQLENRHLT